MFFWCKSCSSSDLFFFGAGNSIIFDGFAKKSICPTRSGIAFQLRRCSVCVSTLHSSVFACLAFGALYEIIVPVTFCEIIILDAGGLLADGSFG
jgi:hypothetical protein